MGPEVSEARSGTRGVLCVCFAREQWDHDACGGGASRLVAADWVMCARLRAIAESVVESRAGSLPTSLSNGLHNELESRGPRQLQLERGAVGLTCGQCNICTLQPPH
jgi:hypothetical protein